MSQFDPKWAIDRVILPKLEEIDRKFDSIDKYIRDGTPWGREAVNRVEQEMAELRTQMSALKESVLTADSVAQLINKALNKAEARGWTARERRMGVGLFIMTLASVALQVVGKF